MNKRIKYSEYIGLEYAKKGNRLHPIHQQGYSSWVTQILFTEYSKLNKWGTKKID
jgi:hypothetical protein